MTEVVGWLLVAFGVYASLAEAHSTAGAGLVIAGAILVGTERIAKRIQH